MAPRMKKPQITQISTDFFCVLCKFLCPPANFCVLCDFLPSIGVNLCQSVDNDAKDAKDTKGAKKNKKKFFCVLWKFLCPLWLFLQSV